MLYKNGLDNVSTLGEHYNPLNTETFLAIRAYFRLMRRYK